MALGREGALFSYVHLLKIVVGKPVQVRDSGVNTCTTIEGKTQVHIDLTKTCSLV